MRKYLYKYCIEQNLDSFYNGKITLPVNSKIISVANSGFFLCVYAFVDPSETEKKIVDILISPTGKSFSTEEIERLDKECNFMGTFVTKDDLVWHVWIKK